MVSPKVPGRPAPARLHQLALSGQRSVSRWPLGRNKRRWRWRLEGPLISNLQDVVVEGALQGLGILYAYDDDQVAGPRGRAAQAGPRPTRRRTLPGLLSLLLEPTQFSSQRCALSSIACWIAILQRKCGSRRPRCGVSARTTSVQRTLRRLRRVPVRALGSLCHGEHEEWQGLANWNGLHAGRSVFLFLFISASQVQAVRSAG